MAPAFGLLADKICEHSVTCSVKQIKLFGLNQFKSVFVSLNREVHNPLQPFSFRQPSDISGVKVTLLSLPHQNNCVKEIFTVHSLRVCARPCARRGESFEG